MARATKIVATLGPASSTPEQIRQLALAGADDGEIPVQEGHGPALYLTIGDDCQEDYGAELSAVGLSVHVSKYRELESLGQFIEVPKGISISHLVLVKGFAIVNHVAPEAIVNLIAEKPKVRGLIGPSACATSTNHDELHAHAARPF